MGPIAGALDSEYEAFTAGFAPGPSSRLELPQGPQPFDGLSRMPQAAPDWAADFQRLHLSSVSTPIPQQDFRSHAPIQRSSPSGWHQDFVRQHAQASNQVHEQASGLLPSRAMEKRLHNGYGTAGLLYGGANMGSLEQNTHHISKDQESSYDEAALERAFEEAALADTQAQEQNHVSQENILRDEETEMALHSDQRLETLAEPIIQESMEPMERIGADTIEDTREMGADRSVTSDGDELARTAGALLDRVKDDHSEKFQQSSFLALMRQLRDKEVVVVGETMVPVRSPWDPAAEESSR